MHFAQAVGYLCRYGCVYTVNTCNKHHYMDFTSATHNKNEKNYQHCTHTQGLGVELKFGQVNGILENLLSMLTYQCRPEPDTFCLRDAKALTLNLCICVFDARQCDKYQNLMY